MKYSDQTAQAKAELTRLQAEQQALPGKIQAVLRQASAETEDLLGEFYARRDALPRLIDLAKIKVLGAEIADLEQQAIEAKQRKEEGKAIITAAQKQLNAAQDAMKKAQNQWANLDADLRFASYQMAAKRRELEDLTAAQTQERGAVVHSTWQMARPR